MEDQGKRLLITVGLVAVLYLVWTTFFMPKPEPQHAAPPPPPAATAPAPNQPAPAPPTAATAGETPAAPAALCDPAKEENKARWETADFVATFSRCGGALESFILKGSQYRVTDKDHEKDREPRQIDLIHSDANPSYFPLQVQVDTAPVGSASADDRRQPAIPARAEWELVTAADDAITFRWKSPDGVLQVTKTFKRLPKSRFAVGLDYEVKNVSSKAGEKRVASSSVLLYGFQDPNAAERSFFHYAEPKWGTACYVDGSLKTDTAKELQTESRAGTGDVKWVGIDHQYFLMAAAPLDRESALLCARSGVPGTGFVQAQLRYDTGVTLEPGQASHQSLVIYSGPKLIDELENVSKVVGVDVKLGDAIDLGWLTFLARPLLFILKAFHGWIGNWGIAIILLTILVKLATLYWTTKSMRSMKAMSVLKPEMDKIREKFPDDKAKQNEEMMKLYRTHKISPFGGCLPMLLQMPIWFALYRTLSASAELFHAPFAGYIRDLTAPDPYYVLPILMVLLMIVQTRVSPTSADSQQQKVMQWTMPAVLGLMSLIFASGLAIYMLTNSVLGIAHQLYMNKTDPKKSTSPTAAAAAKPVAVKATTVKAKPKKGGR